MDYDVNRGPFFIILAVAFESLAQNQDKCLRRVEFSGERRDYLSASVA